MNSLELRMEEHRSIRVAARDYLWRVKHVATNPAVWDHDIVAGMYDDAQSVPEAWDENTPDSLETFKGRLAESMTHAGIVIQEPISTFTILAAFEAQ